MRYQTTCENTELQTPELMIFINYLIRDERINDYADISEKDKLHLVSLAYKADNTWAVESLVENDHWDFIKAAVIRSLRYEDGAFDKVLGDALRDLVPEYFEKVLQELFRDQLTNFKCDVRNAAEQGGE